MKITTPVGELELPDSVRTRRNVKRVVKTFVDKADGHSKILDIEIRWDDQCGNGFNSFAITADLKRVSTNKWEAGGCLHELVSEQAPELAFALPYHLTSADGPMHYFANTTYLAGDRDYNGCLEGEQRLLRGQPMWQLSESPYTIKAQKECPAPLVVPFEPVLCEGKNREFGTARVILKANAETLPDEVLMLERTELEAELVKRFPEASSLEIENAVYLAGDRDYHGGRKGEQRVSKGLPLWRSEGAPFTRVSSETRPEPLQVPYNPVIGEGKKRELDAARSAAIWPDAPDEVLMLPKPELEKVLHDRLPRLMAEFKAVIEQLGFQY